MGAAKKLPHPEGAAGFFGCSYSVYALAYYGFSLSGLRKRNIASFIVSPSSSIVRRSTPRPKPPWGGQPYLKNSR